MGSKDIFANSWSVPDNEEPRQIKPGVYAVFHG